jgi:hypothetical protein
MILSVEDLFELFGIKRPNGNFFLLLLSVIVLYTLRGNKFVEVDAH